MPDRASLDAAKAWRFSPVDTPPVVAPYQKRQLTPQHDEVYTSVAMKKLDVPQSGSQGMTTASRNRFGQYNRQRAMPTQPRTGAQQAVRANLTAVSKAWAGLTDAQRMAWDTYGTAHTHTDSLGQAVSLTGHQSYVGVNGLNLAAGAGIQTAPPDGSPTEAPTLTASAITAAGLSITVDAAVPATARIVAFASPPMSPGRSFNGDFRKINAVVGSAAPAQVVITAALLGAKFGSLITGQKFFFQVKIVDGGNVSSATPIGVVLT